MQSDIAKFLRLNGIDTSLLRVWVFEYLTQYDQETIFRGRASDLEGMSFDPLSVLIIDQNNRQPYNRDSIQIEHSSK
jgi:precorrin-6B methylase 1